MGLEGSGGAPGREGAEDWVGLERIGEGGIRALGGYLGGIGWAPGEIEGHWGQKPIWLAATRDSVARIRGAVGWW